MNKKQRIMNSEELKALIGNEIKPYLERIEMWQCITAVPLRATYADNQWCLHYGGICGYGNTFYKAACDFYSNLKSGKE